MRRAEWLSHYARHFTTVEVNASFYRLIEARTFRAWRAATPPEFRFALKGHRAVTHEARLDEAGALVARQREAALALEAKLAVVLWQLPRSLPRDPRRLARFLGALRAWPEPRHAVEFRHDSWFTAETEACLETHGVAAVISDAPSWPRWDAVTAALVYVRLHGDRAIYRSAYDDALAAWARRIAAWREAGRRVHVYFNNTMDGAAPADAARLIDALARTDGI